jgi:hypothetical protein
LLNLEAVLDVDADLSMTVFERGDAREDVEKR